MELEWRMKSTSVNENMKKKLWRHSVIDSFCCSHITVVIVNYALVTKLWGPCGCVVCGKVVGWSTDKGNYLLSWSSSGAAYLNALRKSVVKFCLVWCECCCVVSTVRVIRPSQAIVHRPPCRPCHRGRRRSGLHRRRPVGPRLELVEAYMCH